MLTRPSVALECILNEISPLPGEAVPLEKARGRYLLRGFFAPLSLPPFDSSAMDGFALRAVDTFSACSASPLPFKIVDRISAGGSSPLDLRSMESVRIMTGAALPAGADAVLPFEEAEERNGFCLVSKPVVSGKHIRRKGEDVKQGDFLLEGGVLLQSKNIPLLAALGISEVPVTRLPRVSLFSTGDELSPLGSDLSFGQIYDSNAPSLVVALQELGIDAKRIPTPKDSLKELEDAFQKGSEADVILTMGAVSAGDFDLIPQELKKLGAKILFHKLAIKPGKPFLFARWENRLLFCLPGNPVSALVVFDRFVRPALLKMMGAASLFRERYSALASETIRGTEDKEDYLRGRVEWKEGKFIASLAGKQGSAQLSTLIRTNALLIVPESVNQIQEGEKIEFEFW